MTRRLPVCLTVCLLVAVLAVTPPPVALWSQQARTPSAADRGADLPIVFVHGNGDHAGLWDTTIWRFESNGYNPDRLFAVDLPHPLAQATLSRAEENRSSPEDQTAALAAFVTRVLLRTGAPKVVLVGSSRGGMTIRNYVRYGGGAAHVSHVILGGTPNHGVFALPGVQPENEFNGAARYLTALNRGSEVVPGVGFLTIRSDGNDKFAQSDGTGLGMPGTRTNVDATGPALRGAQDVVLPDADHREVAFAPASFRAQYTFITGRAPQTLSIVADSVAVLDGMISANANGGPSNLPLAGATVTVHELDAETGARTGDAVHRQVSGVNGRWGPFRARPSATYEFEIVPRDSAVILDVFRPAFTRSSRYVNFRLPGTPVARRDSSSVMIARPRGYIAADRDTVTFDGAPAAGVPRGVPTVDRAIKWFVGTEPRSVRTRLNSETIVVRLVPGDPRRLVLAEFNHE